MATICRARQREWWSVGSRALDRSFQAGRGLTQDRPSTDTWGASGLAPLPQAQGQLGATSHPPGDSACSTPPGLSCNTQGPGKENAQVPPN